MKIDLQNKLNYCAVPPADTHARPAKTASTVKSSSSFDGLTIHSDQIPGEEEQFAASLSSRLSMEIRKPVSPAQIRDLQQQIDEGRYQVDVNTIADRIMLY